VHDKISPDELSGMFAARRSAQANKGKHHECYLKSLTRIADERLHCDAQKDLRGF
jgi:hypothetical protein